MVASIFYCFGYISFIINISENDFGWVAVDALIKAVEDKRDNLVIIVADYTDPMVYFINSNLGSKSRSNCFIDFENYTDEPLLRIYQKMAREAVI